MKFSVHIDTVCGNIVPVRGTQTKGHEMILTTSNEIQHVFDMAVKIESVYKAGKCCKADAMAWCEAYADMASVSYDLASERVALSLAMGGTYR